VVAVDGHPCIEGESIIQKGAAASAQALEANLQEFEPDSSSKQVSPRKPSPCADIAVQKVFSPYFSDSEASLGEISGLKSVAEAMAQVEDPFSALQPTPLVSVKQLASNSRLAPCTRSIVDIFQSSTRGSLDKKSSRQLLTIVLRFPTDPITAPKAVPNAWQDSVDCQVFIKIIPKRHSNDCAKVKDSKSHEISTSPVSFVKSAPVAHAGKSHVQRMQELLLARIAGTC
jgi:hypothetical protein